MLSKSRFRRRLARIPELFWRGLADWLASVAHRTNSLKIYIAVVIVANKACNDYSLDYIFDKIKYSSHADQEEEFKRKCSGFVENGMKCARKRIESAFSVIKQRFQAHTHKSFCLF